jgi:hypothetical protein
MLMAIVLTGATLPASAQQQPGDRPSMTGVPAESAAREQQRGDDLALVLQLKPSQRPALDAFLKAALRPARPPAERAASRAMAPGFRERLDQSADLAARQAADARDRAGAARAFFAQLDARQQQIFEAILRLRQGPMGLHDPRRRPFGPRPDGISPSDEPPPE